MNFIRFYKLNSTTLGGTTTVVWKRSNINDFRHFNTCCMHGTNGRLTTITRPLNVCFNLAETEIESHFSTILCGHLSCIGSILLGTTESHLAGR